MQAYRRHMATWANKKHAKKRRTEKRGRIKRQGWSGGEENERQMANNVMREIRVCDGYLVCRLLRRLPGNGARNGSLSGVQILTWPCVTSPATAPEILLATSWALRWFSLEEERVMQQSSVSISLNFWEPRYQSSRRLHTSPSHLHKQINPRNQRHKGLSIPTRSLTRVRSDRYDKIIFLVFLW